MAQHKKYTYKCNKELTTFYMSVNSFQAWPLPILLPLLSHIWESWEENLGAPLFGTDGIFKQN